MKKRLGACVMLCCIFLAAGCETLKGLGEGAQKGIAAVAGGIETDVNRVASKLNQ